MPRRHWASSIQGRGGVSEAYSSLTSDMVLNNYTEKNKINRGNQRDTAHPLVVPLLASENTDRYHPDIKNMSMDGVFSPYLLRPHAFVN